MTAASRHEATREIAQAIADGLRRRGLDVDAPAIDVVTNIESYDAAVIGSAVYMGRWLKSARSFVEHNSAALSAMPVWLFSSGPLGPPEHLVPEGEPADVPHLLDLTGAREHRLFAGRLERRRLSIAERAAVRAVGAPETDDRDWEAIDAFAGSIAEALTDRARATAAQAGFGEATR